MTIEFRCSECGNALRNDNYNITEEGNLVCSRCATEKYNRCGCGVLIKKEYNRATCKRCDDECYKKDINYYSLKPIPRFKNKLGIEKDLGNRYYGLEMEYSFVAPKLTKILFGNQYEDKMIYNKQDGSLHDGTEIVTSPCDLYSIRKLIRSMEDGFNVINKIPHHTDGAGLHIHVSKKSISPMARIKLGYLLNNKWALEDRRFLMYLSGRLSSLNGENIGDDYCHTGSQEKFKDFGNTFYDRHIALNFNNNNTVEFRIFKSSSDVEILLSYIDTVNIMIDFCENNSIKNININNLCEYILSHSNNNILLDKAKKYFNDDIKKVENIYTISNIDIDSMEYDNIISLYNTVSQSENFRSLLNNINKFNSGKVENVIYITSPYFKSTELYKQIDNKIRKYLTDKIIESVGA